MRVRFIRSGWDGSKPNYEREQCVSTAVGRERLTLMSNNDFVVNTLILNGSKSRGIIALQNAQPLQVDWFADRVVVRVLQDSMRN